MKQAETATLDEIVNVVTGHRVITGPQWQALSKKIPGVSYFATDLDPRSFERDGTRGTWLGRAELLLKAPSPLRPGQALQEVSFTLPVRVVLAEQNGELAVKSFDFYFAQEDAAPGLSIELDIGPPKTIGWGPFEGLI